MSGWVRLWHDMPTDPKWRVIAKKSDRSISEVIAVFIFVMTNVSANANERGRTHSLFADDIAAALDIEQVDVQAILDAMQGKVLDGEYLSGWDKRQPKREDNSASRSKAWREKKETERKRTQTNAQERSDADADADSIPLSNDNGAKQNSPQNPYDEPDPEKVFWSNAKTYLANAGVKNPGGVIGKWMRDHQKQMTMAALNACQLERAVDPVAYCSGYFRRNKSAQDTRDDIDDYNRGILC